jgi:hypothetical protein
MDDDGHIVELPDGTKLRLKDWDEKAVYELRYDPATGDVDGGPLSDLKPETRVVLVSSIDGAVLLSGVFLRYDGCEGCMVRTGGKVQRWNKAWTREARP